MTATTGLGVFSQRRLLGVLAASLLARTKRTNRSWAVGGSLGNSLQARGLFPTASVLLFTQYSALHKGRRAIDPKWITRGFWCWMTTRLRAVFT